MKSIIKIFIVPFVVVLALAFVSYSCNKGSISSPVGSTTSTSTTTTTTTTTTSKYVSEKELMEWLETQKGSIRSFGWVAHAEDIELPPEIYDYSRYTPITDLSDYSFFSSVLDVLLDHMEDVASDLGTTLSEVQADNLNSNQTRYGLPAMPTYQAIKYLVEEANRNGTATLRPQYEFIAKRSFEYPFYNWREVDTLVVYIDENQSAFDNSPIFYENVAIPANSFCLFRSITTSGGTRSTSYVFSADQFSLNGVGNGTMNFIVNPNSSLSAITAITPDGTQTFSMDSGYGYSRGDIPVSVTNNNYNTIFDTFLTDIWTNNGEQWFKIYMGQDVRILSGLECLFGKYANYAYSAPLMGDTNGCSWYLSCGYINSNDYVNGQFKGTSSYDSEHYSPQKAPVYIVDDNSPVGSGSTLNVNNVNDFSDYGVSYNSDTNEFELDVNVLAGLIAGQLIPQFQGTFDAVFNAQPELGMGFDTALDLNMVDTSIDIINSLVPSSGGGGGSFTRPLVPVVTTYTVDYDLDLPSTETMPVDLAPSVSTINDIGYGILDGIEMIPVLGVLCLFGLLVWALF